MMETWTLVLILGGLALFYVAKERKNMDGTFGYRPVEHGWAGGASDIASYKLLLKKCQANAQQFQAVPLATLKGYVASAELEFGIPEGLLEAIIDWEQRGTWRVTAMAPDATSTAIGLGQTTYTSTRDSGALLHTFEPQENVRTAAQILRMHFRIQKDWKEAVKHYGTNTQSYVDNVMERYA